MIVSYGVQGVSVNPFVPEIIECANNMDPDQPQLQPNTASDQDLCCLLLGKDA